MKINSQHEFIEKELDTRLLLTPYRHQTNWHVITGASCSGKTTLINLIENNGFKTIPEVARQYFEGELACSDLLTIAKTGTVKGKLAYGALSVELGGLLEAEIFQLESTDTKLIPFERKKPHTMHYDSC